MTPPRPPLSFVAAAAWAIVATLGFQVLAGLVASTRSSGGLDLVAGVACQAAVFLLVLYGVVWLHAPDLSLRAVTGLRWEGGVTTALAALSGALLTFPIDAIAEATDRRWPLAAAEREAQLHLLDASTDARRVALVIAAAVVGPLVEELLFRGALYGGLRRAGHAAGISAVALALFFAAAHEEPRYLVPLALVGLALGHARAVTGSLLPPLALHVAFNARSVISDLWAPASADAPHVTPARVALLGLGGALAATAALHAWSRRSPAAAAARALDDAQPSPRP